MCLERFSRVQVHNNEFEITVAVILAKLVDGRVSSDYVNPSFLGKHNLDLDHNVRFRIVFT